MAPVRFLIISDTHTEKLAPQDGHRGFREPLPKADVLLHCGDLTIYGEMHEYHETIKMLGSIDAELKLVIAGNHDLSLDADWWAQNSSERPYDDPDAPAKALKLWKGDQAKAAGITYLEEGMHEFTLRSGAKFSVYTTPSQPAFYNWAFMYQRDEDRFNPPASVAEDVRSICTPASVVPDFPAVDLMVTHGPPYGHLDEVYLDGARLRVGCKALMQAVARARPRLHCFGHIHEGWGAKTIRWSDSGESMQQLEQEQEELVRVNLNRKSLRGGDHAAKMTLIDDRAVYIDGRALVAGRESLLVNAAIMDVTYSPVQRPFIVDLDLPGHARGPADS